MADKDPQDHEIATVIEAAGSKGIDPERLINELQSREYPIYSVIEALQRAIERGRIRLNSQGMVVCVQHAMAHAA